MTISCPTKMIASIKKRLFFILLTCAFGFQQTEAAPSNQLPATLASPLDAPPTVITNTPEYVVIHPSDQVTYSSETAASINNISVREGSHFKSGDILLEMDCRLQHAELDKVQAQSKSASLAEASAIKLKGYGSISELELVKAHSEAAIAKAEVDKLTAVVDKCIIKAPFNGAVSDIFVHPFETVKPGDPLLKIVNTENLEFEIQVPSTWLSWLQVGTPFKVRLNETDKTVNVEVARIDPEIESVSQTIKITATAQQADPTLLPGMTGQAIFPDHPETTNKVPGK
jgi:RND family efflux transporter MFP subunit